MADDICINENCELPVRIKGRCNKHYRAWHRKYGTPRVHVARPTECTVKDCGEPVATRTWCAMHYQRWRTKGDPGPADPHRIRGPRVKICKVERCGELVKARGWCGMHYARVMRHGDAGGADIQRLPADAERPPCKLVGCPNLSSPKGKGWCWTHYGRYRNTGDPGPAAIGSYHSRAGECTIKDCTKPIQADRLCQMHYTRKLEGRDVAAPVRRARGDGHLTRDGYRTITADGKQVLEHRFVMEQVIGRALLPTETVHHKNGDRSFNIVSNLELWYKGQPAGQRVSDLIAYIAEHHADEVRAEIRRQDRERRTGQLRLEGMPAAHVSEAS